MIEDTTEYMPILEYIDGYGIIESCNNDHVIIAYKIFEQNYKLNKDLIYITKNNNPINKDLEHKDETLNFILNDTESFFQKQFLANYGFYLNEKLNISNYYRIYFFISHHPVICERVINNLDLARGFVKFFKEHNNHIIDTFTKIKNDFDSQKAKYFKEPNNFKYLSDKDNFFTVFKSLGFLKENINIADDEWKIINNYNYSLVNKVDTSHLFGISKEEMKNRFNKIMHKLLK